MALDKCFRHPLKIAAGQCKRCHAHLCIECKTLTPDGVFCSRECLEDFRLFQSRLVTTRIPRSRFSLMAWIKHIVVSAVLVLIIYGALAFLLKTTDPGEMWDTMTSQIRLLF